jgi:inhibitor of KinA
MTPLGETGIVVELGKQIELETHNKVQALASYLEKENVPAVMEYIPTFTSVTIYYDCIQAADLKAKYGVNSPFGVMKMILEEKIRDIEIKDDHISEIVDIPVCYGGNHGPDLELVARHNNLSQKEVIDIHSSGTYLIYMIGFAPGFPYLGGLSKEIYTPRRESPRLKIPAGSVGIAGNQTGIYPIETPGGWQLIGRTPLSLFDPNQTPPTLLKAGSRIRFNPITQGDYQDLMVVNR